MAHGVNVPVSPFTQDSRPVVQDPLFFVNACTKIANCRSLRIDDGTHIHLSRESLMETDKTIYYKKQQKLSFAQFIAELPNFIALIISALLTGSLIVWLDFLDSLGNVLRTGTVSLLTNRLSVRQHHDVSNIENMAVLFCDGIVLGGLFIAAALSVHEILVPQRPSDRLIYVAALKMVNVAFDAVFLIEQGKIRKMDHGLLAQSNYTTALGMLLFDVVGLLSILLISICKNSTWTWYFSPVISILLAAYLVYKCVSRLRRAAGELNCKRNE